MSPTKQPAPRTHSTLPRAQTIIRKTIIMMRMSSSSLAPILKRPILLLAAFAAFLLPASAQPQEASKRLVLKDGSYQLVTKYEVKGDRVHYYSSEREEWEDIPSSLVDWTATEKYESDRAKAAAAPEAVQLDKELDHERELEEQKLPEVAPGLRLPEDTGVFLLDTFNGEAQLNELQQTEGDINRNTKGNIFRGAVNPVASIKQTIELDGAHARIQSHVAVPALYVKPEESPDDQPERFRIRLDAPRSDSSQKPQQPEQPQQPKQASVPYDRFRLVHAEVKGGKRIVGDVKRSVTGKVSQDEKQVKTTITRVNGGWFKVTPTEPLPPGEYVLVEMMGAEGMNLYVWDFSVNPKAPANTNPWKPDPKETKSQPTPN